MNIDGSPISRLSKLNSQVSFDDWTPYKMESYDIMPINQKEEAKAITPNFKRKLPKPKTEIFPLPLKFEKDCSEEEIKPIIERCKKRERNQKSDPFTNLTRFSSKTFIINASGLIGLQKSAEAETKEIEFLKSALRSHFLFKEWDPFLLEKLVEELKCVKVKAMEVIIEVGKPIRSFYIVAKGSLQMRSSNDSIDILKSGDLLCVSSIFQDLKSASEIVALEESVLWGLEFVKFQGILKSNAYSALQENRHFLDNVPYFAHISKENKVEIAFYTKSKSYGDKDSNVELSSDHLYILKSGSLVAKQADGKLLVFSEGEVLGEDDFRGQSDITQLTIHEDCEEVVLLSICKKTLKLILGTKYSRIIQINELRMLISRSENLVGLDPITRERIIRKLKVLEAKKGDVVWLKGGRKLLFLLKGELVNESGALALINTGIFDEEVLVRENPEIPFSKLVADSEEVIYAEISLEKLAALLKAPNLQGYFFMRKTVMKRECYDLASPMSPFIHIKAMSVALKNSIWEIRTKQRYELIQILKEIGDGQFGLVLLAKIEERFFALKVISRFWIVQNCCEEYLVNEKKICRVIDSPFIIHLDFTFRDQYNIYFLFEYIEGIDLFKFMNLSGIIPTNIAQFYAANLILAIEYLHNKNIIHRDLKPENIMIGKNGFLKVIDLGAAKHFTPESTNNELHSSKSSNCDYFRPFSEEGTETNEASPVPFWRTYTLIGTPEYLAPETIKGTGYHFPVDLWALGVIVFEMLCGYCPFGHNESDPMEISRSILEDELKFPKFMKDSKARKLIRQLLSKTPEERSEGSFNSLKAKKWFDDINWQEVAALKPDLPPYIPENGDAEKEREELMSKKITLKFVLENSSLEELKKQAEKGGLKENTGWDEIF